jgi:hypothetical protein
MSTTGTSTFTRSHARDIAQKIAADLRQMHHHYGQPSLDQVPKYIEEIVELLAEGYLYSFEDGWADSNGQRIVSVYYEVREDGTLSDGRAGGVYAHADIRDATHFNYLKHSQKWNNLPQADRDAFEAKLPVKRVGMPEKTDGNGYWTTDRSYSSGGVGAQRRTYRPL